jgi:hypothetical protein
VVADVHGIADIAVVVSCTCGEILAGVDEAAALSCWEEHAMYPPCPRCHRPGCQCFTLAE